MINSKIYANEQNPQGLLLNLKKSCDGFLKGTNFQMIQTPKKPISIIYFAFKTNMKNDKWDKNNISSETDVAWIVMGYSLMFGLEKKAETGGDRRMGLQRPPEVDEYGGESLEVRTRREEEH